MESCSASLIQDHRIYMWDPYYMGYSEYLGILSHYTTIQMGSPIILGWDNYYP